MAVQYHWRVWEGWLLILLFLFPFHVIHSQDAADAFILGKWYFEQGRYGDAVTTLNAAGERFSGTRDFHIIRGQCYTKTGQYQKALDDLMIADRIEEGCADLYIARNYALMGKDSLAVLLLERHLRSKYRQPEMVIRMDPDFRLLERSRLWIQLWKNEFYTPAENASREAGYLFSAGRVEEAFTVIDAALSQGLRSTALLAIKAKIYLSYSNEKQAEAVLSEALSLEPSNTELLKQRAALYRQMRQPRNAVSDLTFALSRDPSQIGLLKMRAEAYSDMNMPDMAARDIEQYLLYDRDNPEAVSLAGRIYYRKKDFIRALDYCHRAVDLDPGNAVVFNNRAEVYLASKLYQPAINDFSMSLDLLPDQKDVYLSRAGARLAVGDREGACYDWNKAVRLGSAEAIEYIEKNCGTEK